ncbi:MAG: DUF3859 domain-containing protein [Gammaproteobacteria bacterium]|nr:DUF3859 domain-containing protein [Gammaproteobacteria bacterium]
MKARWPVLLITLFCTYTAQSDIVVRAAEITAFGVFEGYGKKFERGYTSTGPGTDSLDYVRFVDFTNEIPGKVGISFGIQYVIHSRPKGALIEVIGIIVYPGEGLISPQGDVYNRSQETMSVKLGEKNFYGFGFDRPWEIVPGEWEFQIRHNDAVLAHKTLTVLEPED